MTSFDCKEAPETSSTNSTVIQWQHLASMDRQSPGFSSLLSSLVANDRRSPTVRLCNANARITLSIMDEILRDEKISSGQAYGVLYTMRMLAHHSGQVPPRYQVDRDSLNREADVVASGAYAEIQRGRLNGKLVAIKTLRIDRKVGGKEPQQLFCKESVIWMNLSHDNILELIGVDIGPQTGRYSMISEMMVNGNIREFIRKNSANRHRLLEGAAAGLSYLHRRGIVHGDLKGNNILITNDDPPRACLADFGLSTLAPNVEGATNTVTAGGTLLYMAPELLFPTKFGHSSATPTKAADMYALGMVIYEVLTGLRPFYGRDWPLVEIFYHVMNDERPTRPTDMDHVVFEDETWELVERCWMADQSARPTVERVYAHLIQVAETSEVVGPTPRRRHDDPLELDNTYATEPSSSFTTTTSGHGSSFSASHMVTRLTPAAPSLMVSPTSGTHNNSTKSGPADDPHVDGEGPRVDEEGPHVSEEGPHIDEENVCVDEGNHDPDAESSCPDVGGPNVDAQDPQIDAEFPDVRAEGEIQSLDPPLTAGANFPWSPVGETEDQGVLPPSWRNPSVAHFSVKLQVEMEPDTGVPPQFSFKKLFRQLRRRFEKSSESCDKPKEIRRRHSTDGFSPCQKPTPTGGSRSRPRKKDKRFLRLAERLGQRNSGLSARQKTR